MDNAYNFIIMEADVTSKGDYSKITHLLINPTGLTNIPDRFALGTDDDIIWGTPVYSAKSGCWVLFCTTYHQAFVIDVSEGYNVTAHDTMEKLILNGYFNKYLGAWRPRQTKVERV